MLSCSPLLILFASLLPCPAPSSPPCPCSPVGLSLLALFLCSAALDPLTVLFCCSLASPCSASLPRILSFRFTALQGADGVLVPGGFGDRGVEGKILAASHARTSGVPYLGICLGMQIAVIEFARNVRRTVGGVRAVSDHTFIVCGMSGRYVWLLTCPPRPLSPQPLASSSRRMKACWMIPRPCLPP